jgi:hypothetical protein
MIEAVKRRSDWLMQMDVETGSEDPDQHKDVIRRNTYGVIIYTLIISICDVSSRTTSGILEIKDGGQC